MSIITLLTDFGTEDAYVGVMKGAILSINPSAVVVDVCHYIDPQDLIEAAYFIKSSYRYFPKGTAHIIVVDPGVGGNRTIDRCPGAAFQPGLGRSCGGPVHCFIRCRWC